MTPRDLVSFFFFFFEAAGGNDNNVSFIQLPSRRYVEAGATHDEIVPPVAFDPSEAVAMFDLSPSDREPAHSTYDEYHRESSPAIMPPSTRLRAGQKQLVSRRSPSPGGASDSVL